MDEAVEWLLGVAGGGVRKLIADRVVQAVTEHRQKRKEEAFRQLEGLVYSAYAHLPEGEREPAVVEALGGSPEDAERLVEAFESILKAIDDAAVPYIAALHASYAVERRSRDRFYRSAGRLLKDASAAEVTAVRAVVDGIAPFIRQAGPADITRLEIVVRGGVAFGRLEGGPPHAADGTDGVNRFELPAPAGWETAFFLLKDHLLATDNPGGVMNTLSGPNVLAFERRHMDGLKRLASLLRG